MGVGRGPKGATLNKRFQSLTATPTLHLLEAITLTYSFCGFVQASQLLVNFCARLCLNITKYKNI